MRVTETCNASGSCFRAPLPSPHSRCPLSDCLAGDRPYLELADLISSGGDFPVEGFLPTWTDGHLLLGCWGGMGEMAGGELWSVISGHKASGPLLAWLGAVGFASYRVRTGAFNLRIRPFCSKTVTQGVNRRRHMRDSSSGE